MPRIPPWPLLSTAPAPAPTQASGAFCTPCGNTISNADKLCKKCGSHTAQQNRAPQRPSHQPWQAPFPSSIFFGLEAGEEILDGERRRRWGRARGQQKSQQQQSHQKTGEQQQEWTGNAATSNDARQPATNAPANETPFDRSAKWDAPENKTTASGPRCGLYCCLCGAPLHTKTNFCGQCGSPTIQGVSYNAPTQQRHRKDSPFFATEAAITGKYPKRKDRDTCKTNGTFEKSIGNAPARKRDEDSHLRHHTAGTGNHLPNHGSKSLPRATKANAQTTLPPLP